MAVEWQAYILELYQANIQLSVGEDSLLWSWNSRDGSISAHSAYEAVCYTNQVDGKWWHHACWQWRILLKVKIFSWLLLEEKILIWDNLHKRGFHGPNICPFCHLDSESFHHLFAVCPFTAKVWSYVDDPYIHIQQGVYFSFQDWYKKLFSINNDFGCLACLVA